jgi:hypothetical protein
LLLALGRANAPTAFPVVVSWELPPQSLFEAITVCPEKRSSLGSAITPGTLNGAPPSVGPTARIRTVFAVEPAITKPAVRMSPAATCFRTETLIRRGVVVVKLAAGVAS